MRDDKARALAKDEHEWQREVMARARDRGTKLERKSFVDLIQRELPWRRHLPAYRDYYR
jgi:hypothetical protein